MIFFIIGGITLIVAIIMAILYNNYYSQYWDTFTPSISLMRNVDRTHLGTIISLIATDIMFLLGCIIQFVKSNKNKKHIVKLIIELITIVLFSIIYFFYAKMN